MPYSSIKDLPKNVDKLSAHQKSIWMKAFNSAFKQYKNEESAFKVAWATVEKADKMSEETYYNVISLGENINQLEVMRIGKWKHPIYGDLEITDKDLDKFKKSFDEKVRRVDLAIDIEHGETPNKGAAAGWFKKLRKEGNKLLADIEWTELGQSNIKSGTYKYFSPEFKFAYKDDETGKTYENVLLGGGLTNRPFIKDMKPVLMSENVVKDMLDNLNNAYKYIEEDEKKMNKDLLKALKLDEKTSEEDVSKAINEYVKKFDEISTKNTELSKKLDENEEAYKKEKKQYDEKIISLSEENKKLKSGKTDVEKENIKLSERLDAVEKTLQEKDWEAVEIKALSEGKITKATVDKYKKLYFSDAELAKDIISSLKPAVELGERGSTSGKGDEGKNAMSKFDEEVVKAMKSKNINYTDALVFCEKENPTLFAEMQKERGVK